MQLPDLANLTLSFFLSDDMVPTTEHTFPLAPFRGKPREEVPAAYDELEREYCRIMQIPYPIREMTFASSWMIFRVRPVVSCTC